MNLAVTVYNNNGWRTQRWQWWVFGLSLYFSHEFESLCVSCRVHRLTAEWYSNRRLHEIKDALIKVFNEL